MMDVVNNADMDGTGAALTVADLAGVVYSSGKVFDGLSTGRLDTENFLRSGSLDGVASRADLALLEDLRDAAQFVIDHADRTIDSGFVRAVNATITRSGALHPGQLRTQAQAIGVATPYGRHTPHALTDDGLQALLDDATRDGDVRENALDLFVELARAQPFEDGNKRTAVFVANSLLIGSGAGVLLTIPVDDNDARLATTFNDLLARAYINNERDGVKELLRSRGLTTLGPTHPRTRKCPLSHPEGII
jgi:prophage maintenance system killer protein